jgi:hypothetical protein
MGETHLRARFRGSCVVCYSESVSAAVYLSLRGGRLFHFGGAETKVTRNTGQGPGGRASPGALSHNPLNPRPTPVTAPLPWPQHRNTARAGVCERVVGIDGTTLSCQVWQPKGRSGLLTDYAALSLMGSRALSGTIFNPAALTHGVFRGGVQPGLGYGPSGFSGGVNRTAPGRPQSLASHPKNPR